MYSIFDSIEKFAEVSAGDLSTYIISNIEDLSWNTFSIEKEESYSTLNPAEKPVEFYYIDIDLKFDFSVDPATFIALGEDYFDESDPLIIAKEFFNPQNDVYEILDKIATSSNLSDISHDLDYMYTSEYSKYLFDDINVNVTLVASTPEALKFHVEFN